MLELATSSELEKTVVASLVDAQFSLVNDQFSAQETVPVIWYQHPMFKSLSSCIRLVMTLEKENLTEEPPRFSSMTSLMTKLNFQQLRHLLVDILNCSSEQF